MWSYGGVKTIRSNNKGSDIGTNPDHNIWNNNGTWWCHFTVHRPDYTKERIRVSLGTKDREEARRQRDFIMRGTDAIVARLPHSRGQAMPDIPLPGSESRAVRNPHGYSSGSMTHRTAVTDAVPC